MKLFKTLSLVTLSLIIPVSYLSAPCIAGAMDGGGGQFVIERKTQKLYYVDRLNSDVVAKMDLLDATPEERRNQMGKGTPSELFKDFDQSRRFKRIVQNIFSKVERLNAQHPNLGSKFFQLMRWKFLETEIELPQLRDATLVGPEKQFQGVYFEDGIAYIQGQFVSRLSDEDIEYLIWKETFRYANLTMDLGVSNEVLEDTVKLIETEDGKGLIRGRFWNLMRTQTLDDSLMLGIQENTREILAGRAVPRWILERIIEMERDSAPAAKELAALVLKHAADQANERGDDRPRVLANEPRTINWSSFEGEYGEGGNQIELEVESRSEVTLTSGSETLTFNPSRCAPAVTYSARKTGKIVQTKCPVVSKKDTGFFSSTTDTGVAIIEFWHNVFEPGVMLQVTVILQDGFQYGWSMGTRR